MTLDNPTPDTGAPLAPPPAPAPASSPASMLARFGRNEQLIFGGAAAVIIALLLGVLVQRWDFDLMYVLMVLGGLAAIAVAYTGVGRPVGGYPGGTLLRISAAIVGAYGLVDFGDLLSSLGDWEALDIVLAIVEVAGAGVLAYAAWAATGASLSADARGAARVTALEMADRFVYLGAVGVVAAWFLLMAIADIFSLVALPQLVILAAVLVLVVRWLDRNPAAGSLPTPAPISIAVLGAVTVVLGVWWFLQVIGRTLDVGDLTTYVPLAIYVVALAALAVGALLTFGATAPRTSETTTTT